MCPGMTSAPDGSRRGTGSENDTTPATPAASRYSWQRASIHDSAFAGTASSRTNRPSSIDSVDGTSSGRTHVSTALLVGVEYTATPASRPPRYTPTGCSADGYEPL